MADIQIYINNILNAVYGEEVRASLVNALTKINMDNEKYQAIKEEVVAAKDTVMDQMDVLDEKYNKALQAVTDLLKVISATAEIQDDLKAIMNKADQKVEELDKAVDDAVSKIADAVKAQEILNMAIGTASQTKEDLDESNAIGSQTKKVLDATIEAADIVAEELRKTLLSIDTTAKEQLTAIHNAGTAEVKKVADTATEQAEAITSTATTQLQSIRTAGAEEVEKVQQVATKVDADAQSVSENRKAVEEYAVQAKENAEKTNSDVEKTTENRVAVEHAASDIVADREQIKKNTEAVADLYQIKADAIICETQGESIILNDSSDKFLNGLTIYGASRQRTTTGAQLLNPDLYVKEMTINGITYTKQEDGSIKSSGALLPGHTESSFMLGNYIDILEDGETYGFVSGTPNGIIKIIYNDGTPIGYIDKVTVDKTKMVEITPYIQFTQSTQVNNAHLFPILYKGTKAKPWEPYTGGKPSPNPDYPQEIESVGDSGSITVTIEDDTNPQTLTLQTPNGLPGIKVSSGGNYTDKTGQQWICDEIDLERGKYVQRVWSLRVNSDNLSFRSSSDVSGRFYADLDPITKKWFRSNSVGISSHFIWSIWGQPIADKWCFGLNVNKLYIAPPLGETHTEEGINILMRSLNDKLVITGILETIITTPLSKEEIAAYKALRTNYPNTTILNSESVGMKVGYVADTKNYIDGKFAQMNAALVNTQKQLL